MESILPPRLEDAGLEDCALSPESVKEAFRRAASAAAARVSSVFPRMDDELECVAIPPHNETGPDVVIADSSGSGSSVDLIVGGGENLIHDRIVDKRGDREAESEADLVMIGGGGIGEAPSCVSTTSEIDTEKDTIARLQRRWR